MCSRCRGEHIHLLCNTPSSGRHVIRTNSQEGTRPESNTSNEVNTQGGVVALAAKQPRVNVIMQTAEVKVMGKNGPMKVNILYFMFPVRLYVR